jgi:hypothetical protein
LQQEKPNDNKNFMKLSSLSDENSNYQGKAQNQAITKYTTTTNSSKKRRKTKTTGKAEKLE